MEKMNKVIKIILIISIALIGAGVLGVSETLAQNDNLVVEFEPNPLFQNTNFLPGQNATGTARVTNNSGQTQRIATEAINYPNPIPAGDLSRALMFIIKEGATDLYGGSSPTGPKSLYDFYQDSKIYSEISLSDLANGAITQYDFAISFPPEKENEWQNATTTFDILIGFQSGGSPLPPSPPTPPSSGGGGGSGDYLFLPPGLTIQNQAVVVTTDVSVLITWNTSYPASSQVIYALEGENHILDLTDNTGTPPKYGYSRTTSEYDTPANLKGVVSHLVTISGLTPGTKYYYRTVSHGSLAISQEQNFTTLTQKEQESLGGITVQEQTMNGVEGEKPIAQFGGTEENVSTQEGIPEKNVSGEVEKELKGEEKNLSGNIGGKFENFTASILGISGKWAGVVNWLLLIFVFLLIIFIIFKNFKKKS